MKRMLNWFRLRKLESDLDRELTYHIDRRVADLIHSGLPEPEARRRVALELGGATQVRGEVRDIWLACWLRDFVYDLRFSARSFLRSPSFTATAVLSLALGIGATTALYSLIDQVVLHALQVDHPERLVLIDWNGFHLAETFGTDNLMSYAIAAISSSRSNSSTADSAVLRQRSISRRVETPSRLPRTSHQL